MRLGQLSGLERTKIEDELGQLNIKIADFKDILQNSERLLSIIKEEGLAIKKKYNDERRTEIVAVSGEVDIEDLIPEEDCVLTLTEFGYIKRQKSDTYKLQRRGGRGVSGMSRREEDVAKEMFVANSHDHVMFFTNLGRVYKLKCYEIPEGSRTSKGMNINNLLPLSADESVTSMIKVPDIESEQYLVMVTRNGIIKRTELSAFSHARKNGLIAIDLNEGDELAWVRLTDGNKELIVATRNGMAIRFHETDVRVMGRAAKGVKAITLRGDDKVIGMSMLREGAYILTVSETGYGRLSNVSDYRIQSRGGKGIFTYRITDKTGKLAGMKTVTDNDDIILITSDGVIIRMHTDEISSYSRQTQGVRVMRLDDGVSVMSIARTEREEETDEEAENSEEVIADDTT